VRMSPLLRVLLAAALLSVPGAARAQEDDQRLKPAEPDFNLVSLPTSLRLPKFGSAFRVTHRFTRSLGAGDFGDVFSDLFGLDNGAVIGLEYRFGIVPNGQIGIHRTNDNKTIEFFGQYGLMRQGPGRPLDISAYAAVDGTNNFRDSYTPALGAIISRSVGDRAAFYIEPMWVNNSNPLPSELVDDNDSFLLGIGARVRIRPTVTIVAETAPRVSGYKPGAHHGSIGIEKRAGGHLFSINISDSFGSTWSQLARGGPRSEDWYLGFSISRKFF
jgi:hypothetical protein